MGKKPRSMLSYRLQFIDIMSLDQCFRAFLPLGWFTREIHTSSCTVRYEIPNNKDAILLFEYHTAMLVIQPLRVIKGIVVFTDTAVFPLHAKAGMEVCEGKSNIEGSNTAEPLGVRLVELVSSIIPTRKREAVVGDMLDKLAQLSREKQSWFRILCFLFKEIFYLVVALAFVTWKDSCVDWIKGWIGKIF